MRYDSLGFPIPPDFDRRDRERGLDPPQQEPARKAAVGPLKRGFIAIVFLGIAGATVVGPAVLPVIQETVVRWSLERAIAAEGRGALDAAIADMTRAISWCDRSDAAALPHGRMLCWRALLRIQNRDAAGGLEDADRAASFAPNDTQPHRVRALALVVLGNPDDALAATETAVKLAGGDDPESLNHRAYFRAILGRDLPAALADIERALAGPVGPSPEFLDTRGYILHLLGRHQEAVDDLNSAIASAQDDRRRLLMLSGHVDADELAYRLRTADHALAVMHHHRGLACRAIGLDRQADQDLATAEKKGFDPSRGIL